MLYTTLLPSLCTGAKLRMQTRLGLDVLQARLASVNVGEGDDQRLVHGRIMASHDYLEFLGVRNQSFSEAFMGYCHPMFRYVSCTSRAEYSSTTERHNATLIFLSKHFPLTASSAGTPTSTNGEQRTLFYRHMSIDLQSVMLPTRSSVCQMDVQNHRSL